MGRPSGIIRPLAILTGMACFAPVATGESSVPQASLPAYQHLMSLMSPSISFPSYQLRLRIEFQRLDADSNGELNAADIALHVAVAMASHRSTILERLMRNDLDGDGVVTVDELRNALNFAARNSRYQRQQTQERVEMQFRNVLAADADQDGRITFEEALNFARAQSAARASGGVEQRMLAIVLGLAGDGGKTVTLAQFEAAGEALFRAADADKNDVVSQDELEAYRRQLVGQAQQRARP
jgi:Ca2+-binding EF-hand superfamily protein